LTELNNKLEHIDELISKYLAGEASPSEVDQVKSWLAEDEANQKYLQQLELIFTQTSSIKEWQAFDADAAWRKMRQKLKTPEAKTIPLQPSRPFNFLKIAASIVIVFGFGFFVYRMLDQTTQTIEVVSDRKTVGDTLPDGSDVFLNRKTKIDYAFNKKENTHKVKLEGEAYFHIKHEDDKEFLVEAGDIFIRDIGTSFNVTAYPDSNTVEVVVEEGEVHFYSDENPGIYLKKGGKGVYNKVDKTFTIDQPENNVLAYKTKFFSFSNARLVDVVSALNEVYDKKIVLSKNLRNCQLTVSFNNEEISEIAQVISETLGLKATERSNDILLEGQGCE
jgi:transmembrane sensor